MKDRPPPTCASSCSSARAGAGSPRSPGSTSGRPRSSPPTPSARWSRTTRGTRARPRRRSRRSTSWRRSAWSGAGSRWWTRRTSSPRPASPWWPWPAQPDCLPVAIVFDLPPRVCHERNAGRPDRAFGGHVVRQQSGQLRRSLRGLSREGFRHVFVLRSPEEVEAVELERVRLWTDRRRRSRALRRDRRPPRVPRGAGPPAPARSGTRSAGPREAPEVRPPEGRTAVFLGDLVDRGPDSPGVLRLVMSMVRAGRASPSPGTTT